MAAKVDQKTLSGREGKLSNRRLVNIYRGYYMPARGYKFEKIKFISTSGLVIFCLLYKHTNNGVFNDFPKISDYRK